MCSLFWWITRTISTIDHCDFTKWCGVSSQTNKHEILMRYRWPKGPHKTFCVPSWLKKYLWLYLQLILRLIKCKQKGEDVAWFRHVFLSDLFRISDAILRHFSFWFILRKQKDENHQQIPCKKPNQFGKHYR